MPTEIEMLPIGDVDLTDTIECINLNRSQSCGVYILHGRYVVLFGGIQVADTGSWMDAVAVYINECCIRQEVHRIPQYNRTIYTCLKHHLDSYHARK